MEREAYILGTNEEHFSSERKNVKENKNPVLQNYDGNNPGSVLNRPVPYRVSNQICNSCEVYVENMCHPYVMFEMYELTDQGECRIKDYCTFNGITCPKLCRPTYGDYICDCRDEYKYGKRCEEIMADRKSVPLRNIHVIYPAVVKAEGDYDLDVPDEERSIMVSWQTESSLDSVSVEYSVRDDVFSDVRRFVLSGVDYNPARTCSYIIKDEETCGKYFGNETRNSAVFSTRFPFIPKIRDNHTGFEQYNYVNRSLLGSRFIGYRLNFSINIKVGSFSSTSDHPLLVYYHNVDDYLRNDCFPVKILPSSCVNYTTLSSYRMGQKELDMYKKSISEEVIISATAIAKGDGDNHQSSCDFEFDFFLMKDKPNLDPNSQEYWSTKSSDRLTLKPFETGVGQFRVEVHGRSVNNPKLVNFAVCFFKVIGEPLKAVIQGGDSRTVYANEDLVMDATGSEDPNNPRGLQTNLLFTWSCNKPDKMCKEHKTKARKYIIKAPIRAGVVFDFELVVSAFNQSAVKARQRVVTTADKFASFSIICRKNCGDDMGSNPQKLIYLETIIKGKEYLEDDEFKWSYSYSNESLMMTASKLRPIEDIMPKNLAWNICIILPDSLLEGKYSFTAFRVKTQGIASYSITIGASPKLSGVCTMKKKQIIVNDNDDLINTHYILQPSYTIHCPILPVNYTFCLHVKDPDNLPIYFINTDSGNSNNVFNYKIKKDDISRYFVVKLYYQSGHYTDIIPIYPEELELSSVAIPKSIQASEEDEGNGDKFMNWILEWVSERQEILTAGEVVQSEIVEYLNTLVALAYSDYLMTELFLHFYGMFIKEIRFENYYDLISVLSPLTRFIQKFGIPALGIDPQFDTKILGIVHQLNVMIHRFEDYEKFFNYDKMISIDEFIRISKSLFECLRFFYECLYDTQNIKGFTSRSRRQNQGLGPFKKTSLIRGTLPRTRREEKGQERNMKTDEYENLKTLSDVLDSSLKSYLNALKKRILPMEVFEKMYGLTFFTEKHAVSVMVDNPMNFMRFLELPYKTQYSFISVSEVLASELHKVSPYIAIKMAFLDKNPFWWDMDESEISSQVLHVEMWQKEEDDSWTQIRSTKNVLDVHLSLNEWQNTTIEGEAVFAPREADEVTKESSVTVFRVWPPLYGGGGTLVVQFIVPDSLRVALTEDFHPDFNYMHTYAKTVDEVDSKVSLTYNLKGKKSFLYIGIIPGPLFKPKDGESASLKFRLEAYIVRCLTRKHSMWLANYCNVNTEHLEENYSQTHCLCNKYTGMIAAAIVAPKIKLQPFYAWQFHRDVEINYIPLLAVVVFLLMFLIFLVWAFHRDRKNVSKRKVIVLDDNFPGENWPYLVGVYTGTRPWSGTDANVGIQLYGHLANSRTHILRSSERQTHSSYSEDWFLLYSPKKLGKITKMHIWMDYADKGADWYCRKIFVYDFSTKEKYLFRLSCWFYISLYSEMLNVYLAPETSIKQSAKHMLGDNFASYFQELHYAVSTIHHHPRSIMSGAEIVTSFWTTIAASALLFLLFYKYDYSGTEDYPYFQITKTDLIVALVGHIPSIIVSYIAKALFKSKVVTKDWNIVRSMAQKLKNLETSSAENALIANVNDSTGKHDSNNHQAQKKNTNEKRSRIESPHQHRITFSEDPEEKLKINESRKYIAWTIVITALLGMCLGIVVEGLSMSKTKSQIWLCVCVLAMFIGLFISNTICVVVHVLIATFIWKKQLDEPVFACEPARGMRVEKMGDKEYLDQILKMRSKSEYYPLKPENVEHIRSQMKSKVLLTSLLELSTIFFVYFLVIFGTMTSWGSIDFHQKDHLKQILNLDRGFAGIVGGGLEQLEDLNELKKYLTSTLNHIYSVTDWYNNMSLAFEDDKFPETGWLVDYTSRMVGVTQIRQKLVKTEECMNPKFRGKFVPVNCCPLLTGKNEDRRSYSVGWTLTNQTKTSDSESQWQYREPDQPLLSTYSQDGRYYSGGGYILNLGRTKKDTSTILWKMDEANWFTHRAEVIFMDSCIYNVNVNKISIIIVCLELGRTYGLHKSVQIVNIEVPSDRFDFLNVSFWLFLGVVLATLIGYVAFMIFEYGLGFFYSFWNVLDFFIMVFFGVSYAYGITNEFRTKFSVGDHLNTGQERFFLYGWVNYHSDYYYFLFVLLIILCTLKLFKYFRNTLQVDPIVRTIFSAGFYLSRITLICLPILYFKFYITDCLLSNPQQPSNRFPLVNNVGLKNYAKHYVFPEDKFVPYLFCQFCTLLMALFSLIIVHHYKISKNSVFFPNYNVDIVAFCKEMWRNHKWKIQIRLRSGAEASLAMNDDKSFPAEFGGKESVNKPGENNPFFNHEMFRFRKNRPDMNSIYKGLDVKLNRIKEALICLSDNLVDEG